MKILGMIGGTGTESTVEYYRRLIATYHARVSQSEDAAGFIINSVDNKNLVKWFTAHELSAPSYQFSRGGNRTARTRGR